jgi:hypothetical protein
MKNKILLFILFLQISITAFSQNLGIGTTDPTSQLHTTEGVRHEILTGKGA